ncbi:MAG: diheme cytochrome c [Hyphomicrobiales bacterium]
MTRTILALAAVATIGSAIAAATVTAARADRDGEGRRLGAVTDMATIEECGACHMAFQPAMLPARSWTAIMNGLSDHFGENAALPDDKAKAITGYLVANAGDASGRDNHFMRGLGASDTPLRISGTPYWIREHRGEVRPGAFEDPRVKSKANCVACHRGAEMGYYEDD